MDTEVEKGVGFEAPAPPGGRNDSGTVPGPDKDGSRPPRGWGRLLAALALALVVLVIYALAGGFAVGFALALGQPDLSAAVDPQALLSSIDGRTLLALLTVVQAVAGALALLFIALLGGRGLVRPRADGLRFVLRAGAWLLVFAGVVSPCLDMVGQLASGIPLGETLGSVSAGWPQDLLLAAAFFLSVGLIEEGLCRGLLLEGLLARMGATRRGVVGAVVISSLVFGAMHLIGSSVSDAASAAQAALKTIQTGLVGFVLATILVKTRNLWCAVALHAVYDLLVALPAVILGRLDEVTGVLAQGYVRPGEEAVLAIAMYLVTCAFLAPAVFFCARTLSRLEIPERGAFYIPSLRGTRPPAPRGTRAAPPGEGHGAGGDMVEVSGLTKAYVLSARQRRADHTDLRRKTAVDGVSFSVGRGEIFGLLGPNGAGKTTTLRLLATLIRPDSGDARVCGHSIVEEPTAVRASIGFLTSELRLEEVFTPDYLFDFFAGLHGVDGPVADARKAELFERFGIGPFAQTRVADLSTGMRQRASLVVSLAHDPEVVIFDEPTNGLDLVAARAVTDFLIDLKGQGKTVLLSTHLFDLAERVCDRVGIIIDGRMAACGDLEGLTRSSSLEDVFFGLYDAREGGADA